MVMFLRSAISIWLWRLKNIYNFPLSLLRLSFNMVITIFLACSIFVSQPCPRQQWRYQGTCSLTHCVYRTRLFWSPWLLWTQPWEDGLLQSGEGQVLSVLFLSLTPQPSRSPRLFSRWGAIAKTPEQHLGQVLLHRNCLLKPKYTIYSSRQGGNKLYTLLGRGPIQW